MIRKTLQLSLLLALWLAPIVGAQDNQQGLDDKINESFKPIADRATNLVFFTVPLPIQDAAGKAIQVPFVVLLLAGSALIFTLWMKFINVRSFGISMRTLRGKYSKSNDPGEITHFQALATALSGTVGLGNIAGVAIGISVGGPGAAFWMIVVGFLGMTTKFCECTLGVKYREFAPDGTVLGGPFYYFKNGFTSMGMKPVGYVFGFLMAVFCVGGAFGGGNMFQVNQVHQQLVHLTGESHSFWAHRGWLFGLIAAILTGAVIIGGIRSIARVTERLVPFMCLFYIGTCAYLIAINFGNIGHAFRVIFESAFTWQAGGGGLLGALIWGTKRAAFSNEAGMGSSPIAHSAVKTRKPASEGYVALLEPFVDTVIVCTMTALVLIMTGAYQGHQNAGDTEAGIRITSMAFETGGKYLPELLFVAVALFAFSTLISWSYYGQQAVAFLTGHNKTMDTIYKLLFCLCVIIGSSLDLANVVSFSEAVMFAMCFPNLIGLYFLMPKVIAENRSFREFAKKVDETGVIPETE